MIDVAIDYVVESVTSSEIHGATATLRQLIGVEPSGHNLTITGLQVFWIKVGDKVSIRWPPVEDNAT